MSRRRRVFLLSPAHVGGVRAERLFSEPARSELARRLRAPEGVPLGEVFAFVSSLYFRGKLAYASAFGRPPPGLVGALVITPCFGLRPADLPVTLEVLRTLAAMDIADDEPRFREPLVRDAAQLLALAGETTDIVLLGSIASDKYVRPLLEVLGERLLFPPAFVGRGDMSRGGMLLRAARDGTELAYAPLAGATRHGPRPARLPRLPRRG